MSITFDVAILNSHSLYRIVTEEIHKYTDVTRQANKKNMANKDCIVPLVLPTTGIIPNNYATN
jgi:hypothetical protein